MFKFALVSVAAFLLAQCNAQFENPDGSPDVAVNFDMLVLAQNWPQTSCWNLNKIWPDEGQGPTCSQCKMPKNKSVWTIHGLWPSNRNGRSPQNCNNEKYNPKLLSSSTRTLLQEKWPTFNLNMNSDTFWSHEWSKHGTCAMDLDNTSSLPKYFSKTLQMIDQYNLGDILSDSGIVPGKSYRFNDIFKVIENTLNVKTYIKCAINPATKEHYLQEFNVCFDPSFQLVDCYSDNRTNCKANVFYPSNADSCN